jgi:phospholipid/cholesterol/gamma-HCH transport system substrate-binding protein
MKRIALSAALLAAIAAGVVLALGASGDPGGAYTVRAIFDDAAFAVAGEDVRIAGATVGTIGSLQVTDRSGLGGPDSCTSPGAGCKAAITFTINRPGFVPFHANAFCAVRPQSLIGEKYVDCNPGTAGAPPLQRIRSGPGAGTYLLPVTNTSSPVDTDLVQDIYRDPVRQQFSLIINELGTGLAARGSDLNQVIRRSNPALLYTDQVLKILAAQHRQLAQLARDSNAVLTPLARMRRQISAFVTEANITSVASAQRASDIAAGLRLLPAFLRQLRPLMADLGALADQGTPLFNKLAQAGPAVARQFENLAPFARAARTSLIALGNSAAEQQPLLLRTIPLARRLARLGGASAPTATLLDRLTASLDQTGAIEDLMKVLFYGTSATNGFDSSGHYIRTEALVGGCTGFAQVVVAGCSANFTHTLPGAAAAGSRLTAPQTRREAAIIRSADAPAPNPSATALTGLLNYLIGGPR